MLIDVEIDNPELLEASVFYRYPNEGGLLLLQAQGQPGTTGVNIKQAMLIEDDWLEVDNRFTVDILR
jgi:hypothetical protein